MMGGKAVVFLLGCVAAFATERIQVVPSFNAPLMPSSPALNQLRLDLAAARVKIDPMMPLSTIISAIPAAATAKSEAGAPVPTETIARLKVAQQILGAYDPAKFADLPAKDQEAAFSKLWDGWKGGGLVEHTASDPGLAKLDQLILDGVRDRELTSANKSVFLGAGVLGYPLEDSLWLSRTRIQDALEDNNLNYPRDQGWVNASGTPEFLGKSEQAQPLVDHWSAASAQGAAIIRQLKAGSRELPKSKAVSEAASAKFAALAVELITTGDAEALDYLERQRDPTFAAFLLDAKKPGYYLYNGDGSVIARILSTKAAARLGIRRLDQTEHGAVVASTYYYRPARVVERLAELAADSASDAELQKARFAGYFRRARGLVPEAPEEGPPTYTFVDPQFVAGSALDVPQNQLSTYGQAVQRSFSRYDLPLTAGRLRELAQAKEHIPSLEGDRWKSVLVLLQTPSLSKAAAGAEVRFVSERYQTGDKLVSKTQQGVMIQVFALDELARLKKTDKKAARAFERFLAATLAAAL